MRTGLLFARSVLFLTLLVGPSKRSAPSSAGPLAETNPPPPVAELVRLGQQQLASNHWDAAAVFFQWALLRDSNNVAACAGLGRARFGVGNFSNALAAFDRAVALDPGSTNALYGLGRTRLELGRLTAAENDFTRYLAAAPLDARAWYWLYQARIGQGKINGAEQAVRHAVQLDPANVDYHVQLGWCLDHLNRVDEAIRTLQEAVQLAPRSAEAQLWLGVYYYDAGRFAIATNALQACLALEPSNLDARLWLGRDFLELKRYPEAAEWLQRAIDLAPTNYAPNFWRGMALALGGQYAPAVTNLATAHAAAPADPAAKSALFICQIINAQYEAAYRTFPEMMRFGGGALVAGYAVVLTLLLRRSLRVRPEAVAPGWILALGWVMLFIEGEVAAIVLLAGLALAGWKQSPLTGMLFAGAPVIYAAVRGFSRQPWGAPFRGWWRPLRGALLGWMTLALAAPLAVDAANRLLLEWLTQRPAPAQETVPFITAAISANPFTAWLAVALVAPVVEEILFRGLVYGAAEVRWGKRGAVLVSALVFAAAHFQWTYFVPIFAVGLALGWLRAKSGSLGPSMVVHCLNNSLSLALVLMSGKN